tara:strand:- start:729 stop:1550 length:822 start_codon:yes stop_codon:yes gene_type:complete
MKYFRTVHEKKSAVITTLISTLLILFFFFLGLNYYDPPINFGMEVNFGSNDRGMGKDIPQKQLVSNNLPQYKPFNKSKDITSKITDQNKAITQEISEVSIPSKKSKKVEVKKKIIPEKLGPPKPKVNQTTKNILSKLVNQTKSTDNPRPKSEGNDDIQGDKGKLEGNPYKNSYFNISGPSGMGKGFGLNGRKLESRGKVIQECNQQGIVVVRIIVNRDGDVIAAEPGVKGSTNTHPCLLKPAKSTAMLHKWFPDYDAPPQQIGFVVIQFKLSE